MIEHFVKRRELWERKYLSKGTGVTSKLSTLSSLVVYLCPHWWFWLVHSMSEKLQGDFLRVGGKGRLGNLSYDELCNLYCPERWDSWELETRWPLIKSCWVRNWKFLEESCGGKVQELGRDGDTGTVQFVLGRSLLKWNQVLTYLSMGNEHGMNFWLDHWCLEGGFGRVGVFSRFWVHPCSKGLLLT